MSLIERLCRYKARKQYLQKKIFFFCKKVGGLVRRGLGLVWVFGGLGFWGLGFWGLVFGGLGFRGWVVEFVGEGVGWEDGDSGAAAAPAGEEAFVVGEGCSEAGSFSDGVEIGVGLDPWEGGHAVWAVVLHREVDGSDEVVGGAGAVVLGIDEGVVAGEVVEGAGAGAVGIGGGAKGGVGGEADLRAVGLAEAGEGPGAVVVRLCGVARAEV